MGLWRNAPPPGWSGGKTSICARRSGEALMRNQRRSSALIATLDWVRRGMEPARAAAQLRQAQFHWGNPPPAALPMRQTRIALSWRSEAPASSDRPCVAGALKEDGDVPDHWFDPLFIGGIRFHKNGRLEFFWEILQLTPRSGTRFLGTHHPLLCRLATLPRIHPTSTA